MSIPVSAVKSLLNSTNAFAGSQAAQPKVILSDLAEVDAKNAKTREEIRARNIFFSHSSSDDNISPCLYNSVL